jgi:hypothetical protein
MQAESVKAKESKLDKYAKRQIRILPWGFIIPGIIAFVMGFIFTILLSMIIPTEMLFYPYTFFIDQGKFLIIIGLALIIVGIILRIFITKKSVESLTKKSSIGPDSDEEPTTTTSTVQENPSSFLLFPKHSLSRIGLFLIIYSIIAIILYYVIPWAILFADKGVAILGHTLLDSNGVFLENFASSQLSQTAIYYHEAIYMVLSSYILTLILGIFLCIIGIIQLNFIKISRMLAIVGICLGFSTLLAGVFALIGVTRILSLHLLTLSQSTQFNFGANSFGFFPSAYIALCFGLIILKNGIKIITKQTQNLEPIIQQIPTPTPPLPTPPTPTTTEKGGKNNE